MKRRFENLTRRAGRAIKHWWLMTIAGVLAVAAGPISTETQQVQKQATQILQYLSKTYKEQ